MKKLTALLLAVLLIMPMAALADPVPEIKSSQEFVVDKGDGKYQVFFYAEVENVGDEPMASTEVLVDLTDADGNVYMTSKANSISPLSVQPGGIGFTWRQENLKDVPDGALISDYNVTINTRKASAPDQMFPAEYKLITEEKEDRIRTSVEFVITNDLDDIYMWPTVVFGIYDQNDQIMYAGFVQAADAGIIPGNQVLLLANISDDVTRAWFAKGCVPTSVKFVCKTARKK